MTAPPPVSGDTTTRPRVAVVLSHPVQYYSPWFRCLVDRGAVELQVFYLWATGTAPRLDVDFGVAFSWDIPLLDGYPWQAVDNVSPDPGTHHFGGLDNPGLVDAVAAWTPDVVVMFGYAYRSHLRLLLSPRLRGVPKILRGDSHELAPRPGLRNGLARLARRLLFSRFAAALAVGRANREYLRISGLGDDQIVTAPHCVDNARFRASPDATHAAATALRAQLGIDPDARVVLFVGKFEDKKRPLDLLEAFAAARAEASTPTILLFVGNGSLEERLRERAQLLGIAESVRFLSFQNQRAMPSVYATGQLLVLPSFGSGETWGLCVNEAMNLALPVLVSSHVGCGPDLVIDDQTGWTFLAGDTPDLQRALGRILSMPAHALAKVGVGARDHVADWSYANASQALEQLARRLRAGGQTRR